MVRRHCQDAGTILVPVKVTWILICDNSFRHTYTHLGNFPSGYAIFHNKRFKRGEFNKLSMYKMIMMISVIPLFKGRTKIQNKPCGKWV